METPDGPRRSQGEAETEAEPWREELNWQRPGLGGERVRIYCILPSKDISYFALRNAEKKAFGGGGIFNQIHRNLLDNNIQ